MPLPLLIPVAVAASSSSFSLFSLITSTTLALTGGLAVGTQFSNSSSSNDNTSNNMSLSGLMNDMYKETEDALMYMFRDFKDDKKVLVESTAKLSTLSTQLNEATEATKKTTQNLQEKLEKPLERVDNELGLTKKKTEEVLSQLTKYKRALTQANKKMGELTVTLKRQQETVTRLNAEVVPLTNALSIQTKEKENALKNIGTLKATFHQQQEDMKKKIEGQTALNKRLGRQNRSLEQKLVLVGADYQKTMEHKLALETLITDYNNQQTASSQRIKELEEAYKTVTSEKGSTETKNAYEQNIKDLMLEKQQLQESCEHQILINTSLNQTILLLKQKIVSLESSMSQLKKGYDGSVEELEKVNLLTESLRANSKEHEAIIAAQEEMIETLMTGRPSKTAGSLGFFAKKASVTNEVVSTNPSPNFH